VHMGVHAPKVMQSKIVRYNIPLLPLAGSEPVTDAVHPEVRRCGVARVCNTWMPSRTSNIVTAICSTREIKYQVVRSTQHAADDGRHMTVPSIRTVRGDTQINSGRAVEKKGLNYGVMRGVIAATAWHDPLPMHTVVCGGGSTEQM
jgi:hypothetical protein